MKKYFRQIIDHLQALWSWLKYSLRPNSAGDFKPFRRYRLSLDRTSSLTRLWSVSGSKFTMILLGVALFIAAGLLWLAAVVYTPLRNLLPARFTYELRDRYTDMSARVDSINEVSDMYGRYLSNLHSILADSLHDGTGRDQKTEVHDIPLDSLLTATEREKTFVRNFEDRERFNLSVLSPIAAEGMVFFPPLLLSDPDIIVTGEPIPSVSVTAPAATGVSAIYRGTVLSINYTSGRGFTVIIQHPNDFVSVYSNLTETFCVRGAMVAGGERIGLTAARKPLSFELWHNGTPLSPLDYIAFSPNAAGN